MHRGYKENKEYNEKIQTNLGKKLDLKLYISHSHKTLSVSVPSEIIEIKSK